MKRHLYNALIGLVFICTVALSVDFFAHFGGGFFAEGSFGARPFSPAPSGPPEIAYIAPTQSRNFDPASSPDDHFLAAAASVLDNLTNDSFTISYWFNPDIQAQTNVFTLSKTTKVGAAFTGWAQRIFNINNNTFDVFENGAVSEFNDGFVTLARTSSRIANADWTPGVWSQVTVTFDISTKNFRMIIDGFEDLPYDIFAQTDGFSHDDSGQQLSIGGDSQSPVQRGFDGNILHAAVWIGVAADSTQRADIYNSGVVHDLRQIDLSPGSIVRFWPLDENFGDQNIVGAGTTGTLSGTTLVSSVP